ncbi:MAG TPA: PilX N-terminal domain-containing pilus assembly protein [Xanthomonadales bacterium]|nr:PilX N-terminal domain-containing pilus assembly protein [Xanthomonadales bacterium]
MKQLSNFSRQKGVALFVGLILLLVMTVLGISAFQNSHIQERAAGNARLQSLAFEAAAAGASNSINFFEQQKAADALPDEECGDNDHVGWENPTDWVSMDSGHPQVTLEQRLYCLADAYPDSADCEPGEEDDGETCIRPPQSQLFVLSRGQVFSGGDSVAMREVEVRLDIGHNYAVGDGCGALCFPSCNPGEFEFPNSNVFQVNGQGGPSITGGCDAMSDAILAGIKDNRIGNYIDPPATSGPGSPWDTPENTESFRENLEALASTQQSENPDSCQTLCYYDGDGVYEDNGNSEYGTVENMQLTYIAGDADFGGGISGAGIMMVEGNLNWNGTPDFKGLIVTLGGTFTIDGGGLGGNHAGSVVILNHEAGTTNPFGDSSFGSIGGGTAEYNYNCAMLQLANSTLLGTTPAANIWDPQCNDGPGNPFQAGPKEMVIASWRENIGWREEFFGSGD